MKTNICSFIKTFTATTPNSTLTPHIILAPLPHIHLLFQEEIQKYQEEIQKSPGGNPKSVCSLIKTFTAKTPSSNTKLQSATQYNIAPPPPCLLLISLF